MTHDERKRLWQTLDRLNAKLDEYKHLDTPSESDARLAKDLYLVMKLAIQGERIRSLLECFDDPNATTSRGPVAEGRRDPESSQHGRDARVAAGDQSG